MTDPIRWRPIKRSVLISRSPRRLPVAVAAVTASLIAAIALAVHDPSTAQSSVDDSKSAAGAHTRQGAKSAAAKAAAAFGGEQMFGNEERRALIGRWVAPDQRERILADADDDYRPLAQRIGLDSHGAPPAGADFVSRTVPAGTTVRSYTGARADVEVWCSTLFGLTGPGVKEIPKSDGWITMSLSLRWTAEAGWLVTDLTQRDGPEPADVDQVPDL